MENWREKYNKNFARGISVSLFFHLLMFLIILLFYQNNANENDNHLHLNTYTMQLENKFVREASLGGGGSLGNLIDEFGNGLAAPKTLSGIPVPSSDTAEIEFGSITNLSEPKDSTVGGGKGFGTGSGTGLGSGSENGIGDGGGWGVGYKPLPFIPRQILEVLPQNMGSTNGEIILLLLISRDGSVKEHNVIYDTTNDPICLKNTIDAAYKSKWEKIKIEGNKIEYWVEKRYHFEK